MHRIAKPIYWQLVALCAAVFVIIGVGPQHAITGMVVSEPPSGFAAPYDPWTGEEILTLSLEQQEGNTFSATAEASGSNHAIYQTFYYYTNEGWMPIAASDGWQSNRASATITDDLSHITEQAGDDLYVAAWLCTVQNETWQCGCQAADDCGHWYVQSLELPDTCTDEDGDGYCVPEDCDDTDAKSHPEATETCGDGKDQDCNGADEACPQGLFSDDFESGTSRERWDYINPYTEINGDNPYEGTHSLNFQYANGQFQTEQYATTTFSPSNHVFYRYYIFFEEDFIQPIAGVDLATIGGVTQTARRWQGETDRAYLRVQGEDSAVVLASGQWHCIETEVAASETNVWVDEGLVLHIPTSNEAVSSLKQGGKYYDALSQVPVQVYIDDVIVDTDRIGC